MKIRAHRLAGLVLSVVLFSPLTPSYGSGIPTFDGAVLAPSVTGAISNMAQQLKQVEQYRLQLQQYINMLQNTMNPGLFIWDNAQETMNDLRYMIDTVSFYRQLYGTVSGFTGNFHDMAW
ncbi:MAG: conjugal transfer protein TrbJ, partial [Nitrospira sp.]|nr:conjugal transfer protein TrbJ [Nitrospira sp.]